MLRDKSVTPSLKAALRPASHADMLAYYEARLICQPEVKVDFFEEPFSSETFYFAKSVVPLPKLNGTNRLTIIVPSMDYVYLIDGEYGHNSILNMSGDGIDSGLPERRLKVYSDILPRSLELDKSRCQLTKRIGFLEAELSLLRRELEHLPVNCHM